jgi:hypothetical protein
MREGMYLGRPPVNIGRARARAVLATMLRGSSSYAGAAGQGAPLAMPQGLQAIPRSPSNPQRNPAITALYPLSPAQAKTNLRQQFGIGS